MIEILPIKLLTDEDSPIFGQLNVSLGKLARNKLPVASAIVVTPPNLKLKTALEHYDFGKKEIFEQSLTLVKKDIASMSIPVSLSDEVKTHKEFLVNGLFIKSVESLWKALLDIWLAQIKDRLWEKGFYPGITEGLNSQIVIYTEKVEAFGRVYFDPILDDSVINVVLGNLNPSEMKKIDELVKEGNKKLFIPHEYEWILDGGIKLVKVLPYTPPIETQPESVSVNLGGGLGRQPREKSVVKVFLDLSTDLVVEKNVDGVYIASEKIFDLNKPTDSFEQLVFKLVESAMTFPESPVFLKLADKSEGMGKVRGTLRLLHQKSLFNPLVDALDFVRHKKGLTNVHIVVPFVRGVNELLEIKRELASKKLSRKNSLELWMEAAVPENILNLENYLLQGLDGVVLNLDELNTYLGGFDHTQQELNFYKNQISGLLTFLGDGLKLLHKSKVPFIAYGNLSLYPEVLDFLVGKGVYGIVVERYEAHSAIDFLRQAEKRVVLKRMHQ